MSTGSSADNAVAIRKPVLTRDARAEELPVLVDITWAAYAQYAAAMPPDAWEEYRQNIAATITQDGPVQRILAEQNGAIVGSVIFFPTGSEYVQEPMIRLLAASPAARGQGVGAALMQECLRRAHAAGAATIVLHTTMLMDIARRMYERLGFVRAPELDFHVPLPPAPGGEASQEFTVMGYRLDLTSSAAGSSA